MFGVMEETYDKRKSTQVISSRRVQHSAALLPAAFGTTNENARCEERIWKARVLYIVALSIFVNGRRVKENLASVCVCDVKSAFRRQGPALTYFSQGYVRTSAGFDATEHVRQLER